MIHFATKWCDYSTNVIFEVFWSSDRFHHAKFCLHKAYSPQIQRVKICHVTCRDSEDPWKPTANNMPKCQNESTLETGRLGDKRKELWPSYLSIWLDRFCPLKRYISTQLKYCFIHFNINKSKCHNQQGTEPKVHCWGVSTYEASRKCREMQVNSQQTFWHLWMLPPMVFSDRLNS